MHWRITVEAVDPTGEEYRKEFLVENPDLLPMGLNVESEYTVVVRRPKP